MVASLGALPARAQSASPYPVRVSANGRHLANASGQPFLLHGDTAWSLIVQLTRGEAEVYLENRRLKGFNAILVNLIEYYNATNPPKNKYGNGPFTTPGDFSTPNEAYFAHADHVIQKANEKGILVVLNPCYAGYSRNGTSSAVGWLKEIIANGPAKCRNYGRYVGNRYKGFTNILWQAVGDMNPPAGGAAERNWLEILQGIKDASPASGLWSAHYQRFSTARDLSAFAPHMTLDNAYGGNRSYVHTLRAYNRADVRPTFYNEGYYEDANPGAAGLGTAQQMRAQAYWALLSGATGHIFGSHQIWAFGGPLEDGLSGLDWRAGMERQGSHEMVHVQALFQGRAWQKLVPDRNHTVVTGGYGTIGVDDRTPGGDYVTAARTGDGSLVMAYVPSTGTGSRTITVDMARLSGTSHARWYNPTNGAYTTVAGSPFANSGSRDFTTPGNNGTGTNDWVLAMETAISPPPLPTVTVTATDPNAAEPSATGTFTIERTGVTTASLTVNFAVSGTATSGTDHTSLGTSVVIPAGAASATKTVAPIDDSVVEGNETVILTISSNTAYTVGAPSWATVTIADDDVASPPTAPSGLTATAPSSTRINLAWTDNSSNESGFEIERKTGFGGTWSRIVTVGAGVTSYSNTGLSAFTTYYYRVRATGAAGDSVYSNEANATTAPPGSNLLPNGDMESGIWANGVYGGSPTRSWASDANRSATHSLKTVCGTGSFAWWKSARVSITPGASYEAAMWIKTQDLIGTNSARLNVKWLDSSGTEVRWDSSLGGGVSGTTDWHRRSATRTAPTNAVSAEIQIRVQADSGTAWVDDVTLAPLSDSGGLTVEIDFVSTGRAYSLSTAQIGALPWIDRSYSITALSAALSGGRLVRTAMDDKHVTTTPHLRFTVNQSATVYVCYDVRATTFPTWLNDGTWTIVAETMKTTSTPAYSLPMRVLRKSFPSGQVILGGNRTGDSTGAQEGYFVVIK